MEKSSLPFTNRDNVPRGLVEPIRKIGRPSKRNPVHHIRIDRVPIRRTANFSCEEWDRQSHVPYFSWSPNVAWEHKCKIGWPTKRNPVHISHSENVPIRWSPNFKCGECVGLHIFSFGYSLIIRSPNTTNVKLGGPRSGILSIHHSVRMFRFDGHPI